MFYKLLVFFVHVASFLTLPFRKACGRSSKNLHSLDSAAHGAFIAERRKVLVEYFSSCSGISALSGSVFAEYARTTAAANGIACARCRDIGAAPGSLTIIPCFILYVGGKQKSVSYGMTSLNQLHEKFGTAKGKNDVEDDKRQSGIGQCGG
eukprot:TRINITY_DN55862_c0_g1_i1.p1 TRINITY_DN55862_c0_g1~~TRINITY_DN55862_c0_g1_i1.p1  ORF type:complete len:151 (-),score=29.29 TRINITY_DN55862_c0_g1_i1:293-745(-)